RTCLGGFPPPGKPVGSDQLVFSRPFDAAATEWVARISSEEHRRLLQGALETRRELAEGGGLFRAVRGVPDADSIQRAVVCHSFGSFAALGAVDEAAMWDVLSDSEWVRACATRLEPVQLQSLCWGLLEVQRWTGGRWHWALPHLLGSLAEELDLPPE